MNERRGRVAKGLLLVAATVLAYLPAVNGRFVWDDDAWTTGIEPLFHGLAGLGAMWRLPTALQQYYPLTGTSFWIDYQLWKFWTLPYHVENVLLHGLSAVLLWRLLDRLRARGAWLAAAIFALHPLMVESVAWITERKNALSVALFLAALLAYARFAGDWAPEAKPSRRRGAYAASLALFLAALLAKPTTFALPVAMLAIAWWRRGRLEWRRDVVPALPFVALALGSSALVGALERRHVGALGAGWSHPLAERVLIAGRALWFYVGKLVWPARLTFVYPLWRLDTGSLTQWLYPLAAVAALAALWLARARLGRAPFAAVVFYVVALAPVLGFANVYYMQFSYVCDHWAYLPSLGLVALGAAGLSLGAERLRLPRGALAPALVVLAVLATLTWRQCGMYADLDTLWRTTLARNPDAFLVHNNLGVAALDRGDLDEAVARFETTLAIHPRDAFAHSALGNARFRQGRMDEAIAHYRAALEIRPDDELAHNNLATALLEGGEVDEAIAHYRSAVAIEPRYAEAQFNLGSALLRAGHLDEAIASLERALRLDPGNAAFRARLEFALARRRPPAP